MHDAAAGFAVLLVVLVAYAAAARRLDRLSVTSAIVFTLAGLLLGGEVLDLLPLTANAESTKLLAESALAVLLFADASTVDARSARRDAGLVARLLLVGLPLAIVFGMLAARPILPDLSWAACALLACALAPTDAALGMAIFGNRAVPARVRRILNVESGLNDGIATPLVFFFIAVVVDEATSGSSANASDAIVEAVRDMGVGIAAGAIAGGLGGLLLARARRRGWTTPESEEIGVLALAALSYVGALAFGANGFVAAFTGGLVLGAVTRGALRERMGVTDVTGQVLAVLTWVIFGAVFVGPVLADGFDGRSIAYAVVSLTVVRMAAVAIAMARSGMRPASLALMGWFGPRGLASVVFGLIILLELEGSAPGPAHELTVTVTWTVLLSVLLHGLSAGPLGRAYGRRSAGYPPSAPELAGGAEEPRMRGRHLAAPASPG